MNNRLHRSLLSLILLSFSQSGNAKLDCPVSDEPNNRNNNTYDVEGRYDKYLTAFDGSLIERMRSSKTETFYNNVLNNLNMYFCDVDTQSERCVDENSNLASKDSNGNCIVAADSVCPSGFCERISNCYWNVAITNQSRSTRYNPDDYVKAKESLFGLNRESYFGSVLVNGAIGIVISAVLLMLWIVFFVIRYMCCCLWGPCGMLCFICSPIPKQRYKTCSHKFIPILFYIVALAAVAAAASFAFLGNEEISVGLTNTFLQSDGLADDLRSFLLRSKIPLVNIYEIIDYAASDAKLIFDGTEFVTEDALSIVSSFLGFYTLHSQSLNESSALSQFESALTEFEDQVKPISMDVAAMLDTLEFDLYNQADTIEGGIIGAIDQIDSFTNQTSEWQQILYEYEGEEYGFRPKRRAIAMSVFLVSFLFGLLGLIAILLSKSQSCSTFFHALKLTGFFSAIVGSFTMVLASILLIVSIFGYDSCKMLSIMTKDLEPFVGEKVAPGANAIFNDTNLAVAFNITDKVEFQEELDEGLSQIENINVTSSFDMVFEPLIDIQSVISSMTDPALAALNQLTSYTASSCPFDDIYTKSTMIEPWTLNRDGIVTPYIIRDNLGSPISYDRIGSESSTAYLQRIYNIAGICYDTSECCLVTSTPPPPANCNSNLDDTCDFGVNCGFPCGYVQYYILEGHEAFLSLYEKERKMTADLGVICPDTNCPSDEFTIYSNRTLVDQLEDYKTKISSTKDSLVALASTSVGDAMDEVEDFLCNMNVSFVERRYNQVKSNICGTTFLGLEKLMWSLWTLGIALEVIAIVSHVLSVRLGRASGEKFLNDVEDGSGHQNGLSRAGIY